MVSTPSPEPLPLTLPERLAYARQATETALHHLAAAAEHPDLTEPLAAPLLLTIGDLTRARHTLETHTRPSASTP